MQAANAEELEALRIKYLSKKGEITALFNEFRNVPNEEKRELGQMLNHLRQQAEGVVSVSCVSSSRPSRRRRTSWILPARRILWR